MTVIIKFQKTKQLMATPSLKTSHALIVHQFVRLQKLIQQLDSLMVLSADKFG